MTPFKKITEINKVLEPYRVKAFYIPSQKLMEFVNLKTNEIVLRFYGKRVRDVDQCDIDKVIGAASL